MNTETHNIPLAIVGIGCLFPKAAGSGHYWANVKHGVDCVTEVPATHWNPADYFDADPKTPDMTYARRGGFLEVVDFNPREFGISPRDIEATDTTQLLGLVVAKQALTDAGVVLADRNAAPENGSAVTHAIDRTRVSVILGVTGTLELVIPLGARLGHPKWKKAMKAAGIPDDRIEDAAARIAESYVPWQENSFPGLLGNVVAGRIANRLDLQGTNCVVDAACASSLSAVHLAAMELQTGRADVVVTGGCDTFNDIFMYMCFSKTPALSPTGDAKPFDANGDGTILGEGLGVVVLKRLADAEAAGDTIYAVIKGIGSSSDGKGNAIYAPSSEGQVRCLQNAYRAANITPNTIELVEAHGTGTRVGDAAEATALTEVYSGNAATGRKSEGAATVHPWCALGSVKSQIGHTKAAAGAASLIKVALALYYKVLPPTIKVTQPVEPLADADSPFYVNTQMRPWLPRKDHPRRAALSAFGFGGSNFHAVLEEYDSAKPEPDWDGSVEVVAVAANTLAELATELGKIPAADWPAFARFAETSRAAFNPALPCRLAFAAHRTLTDLPKLLVGAKARLASEPDATAWETPDGVSFSRGTATGSLAVLFPGQGSQAVGMLRDLACLFPEMIETLGTANTIVAAQTPDVSDSRRLSDRIYPPTSFAANVGERQDAELRDTKNAQPALGAVSFGAWRVLNERFGLKADALAGHSYGELVALAAAGRFTPNELFALSRLRGRLMGERGTGDSGSMLAVLAPLPEIEQILAKARLNLVIANRNGPKQAVLSGATAEIERAQKAFAEVGVKSSRLAVAAAFHSSLVADAAIPFRAALDGVAFTPGAAPVFANTTAAAYPIEANAARDLLANQLAKPVAFVEQIRAMADAGVRTFVEVGPGMVLARLAESILTDAGIADAAALALDSSNGKRPGVWDLGRLIARVVARGHRMELAAWEQESRCRPAPLSANKPGMTMPLSGANHVSPRTPRPPIAPLAAAPLAAPVPAATANGSSKVNASSPIRPAPLNPPAKVSGMSDANPNSLAQALALTQQSLAALQRMQEQTASLHKQFLESQESAHRTVHALVEQQQTLLFSGLGTGVNFSASIPITPAPVLVPVAPAAPLLVPAVPVAHVATPAPYTPPAPAPVATAYAPPAAVVKAAVPTATPVPTLNTDRVSAALLAVVSEKTGYPVESLDLSLSLDGDLGVDSIKRVEILSSLQERLPEAPQVKPEHLGSLHTLRDVAAFLVGSSANGAHAPTVATPAPTVGAAIDMDRVSAALLAVVSEKTGYPVESLDLSLSLDGDLGVDSIKRVEILSSLQERLPEAPQVKPEHLGSLHTLRDVAAFLVGSSANGTHTTNGAAKPSPPSLPSEVNGAKPPAGALSSDRVDRSVLRAIEIEAMPARPRVAIAAGSEIWVVGAADALTKEVIQRLGNQSFKVRYFDWSAACAVSQGGAPAGLVLIAPIKAAADLELNRRAFEWVKAAGAGLRQAAQTGGAVLACVARLDGAFGLADLAPDTDPIAGGLAGLVKTARHEWPEVACKCIDLSPAFANPQAAATAIADEVLTAGPIEVGIGHAGQRCQLALHSVATALAQTPFTFGPTDVVLVTGGARGVTAEVATTLAAMHSPTIVLTGRTPLPEAEPAWLTGLKDEAELKKAIATRLGAVAGPRQVGEHYAKVMAQREVARTLQRIANAGGRVEYIPSNIVDPVAAADLCRRVREKFGPITAVVHGAGVLADKRLEDLTPEQFDQVYKTKVTGLRNILREIAAEPLKALVLFSSTTARLGRIGQAAYACANEVLNKIAQIEARRRPACRVLAVNWGPWEGGMVTPGLRKVFESEGVGLIPLAEGAAFLLQELRADGAAVEVVALGRYDGVANGVARNEPHAQSANPQSANPQITSPQVPELSLAFERSIDMASHPILASHVLDGKAVLPMALHLEWLVHAALHGNPGLLFHGFNDLRVTSGIQIDNAGPPQIQAFAGKAVKQDRVFMVPVELRGLRKDGRHAIHSRAEIVLVSALPSAPPADRPPPVSPLPYDVAEAYREWLFHGPDLHGIERMEGASDSAFIGTAYPSPLPAEWFRSPLRSSWVADPLVLDAAFQMMILWTQTRHGSGSLPCFASRYRQYRKNYPADPVTVVIRVRRDDGKFARADIDFLDPEGQVVAQMQDYECIMEKTLNEAFRNNQLVPQ